jgi:CelD/BcsL family acetyltransferase involved in cellulose biosynthesis
MNVVIHTGNQAMTHMASEEFRSQWRLLYDACAWATAFQHPDFVMPWYELYQDKFLPVLVVAEAEDHSLTGLLTLALHAGEKKLVGAGERQAEYHAWLEKEGTGSAFIEAAVKKIRADFPGIDLCLKYLPPAIPLDWIARNRLPQRLISLLPYRRPVMKIDAASMDRQRRKKNHRQNFNRLKKSGEVSFEKIGDHDRFLRVFDDLCMQYDFRQGALHHYMPFVSDPAKRSFYLELHRRGMLHTSILKVGDEIAASHSGLISKGSALHLGINTHAPALAAHSPGNLLLAMLGVHLVEEKLAMLDLTPGGDGYKENFATEHDVVHELIVYGGAMRRWRNEAVLATKRMLKTRMRKAGWSTADAWAVFGKITKFRELGFRRFLQGVFERVSLPVRVYRYCPEIPIDTGNPFTVFRNCLRDIMLFDSASSSLTRWEFFKTAMERLERSIDSYSYAQDGKLLLCCWVRMEFAGENEQGPGKEAAMPDRVITLFDLYVHREIDDSKIIERFIAQILSELKDGQAGQSIYFRGALGKGMDTVIRQCGFIDETELDGSRFGESSALSKDMQDFSTGT